MNCCSFPHPIVGQLKLAVALHRPLSFEIKDTLRKEEYFIDQCKPDFVYDEFVHELAVARDPGGCLVKVSVVVKGYLGHTLDRLVIQLNN